MRNVRVLVMYTLVICVLVNYMRIVRVLLCGGMEHGPGCCRLHPQH